MTICTSEHTVRDADQSELFAALPPDVFNVLTEQRDALVAQIDQAADIGDLEDVLAVYRVVTLVWHPLGYGYKARETYRRLVARAGELVKVWEAVRDTRRVGTKNYGKAARYVEDLETFASRL